MFSIYQVLFGQNFQRRLKLIKHHFSANQIPKKRKQTNKQTNKQVLHTKKTQKKKKKIQVLDK